MKTRSIFGILLVVLLTIGFVGCNDDDNRHGKGGLPQTARAFIDSRLPGYTVLKVDQVDDRGDEMNEKYIVAMSGNIVLSFSSLGFWRRIESASELPQLLLELLPDGSVEAVKAKHPSNTIRMIHFKLYGCMVALSDDTQLAFYDVFSSFSSNKFGLDLTKSPLSWPETSRNLLLANGYGGIAQRNPHYFIRECEEDGSGYRFSANQAIVYFDKTGEWYYADGGSFSVPSGISDVLPEQSRQFLSEEYRLGTGKIIAAIVRNEGYFLVKISNANGNDKSSNYHIFCSQTGLEIKAPEQAVRDFVKNYMGEPNGELELQSEIVFDTKQDIYHFEGTINGRTVINIYTDRNGRMLMLDMAGSVIPNTVLSYLPEKVKEYAESHYAEGQIIAIVNGFNNEYLVVYKNNVRIPFDKDSNVVI